MSKIRKFKSKPSIKLTSKKPGLSRKLRRKLERKEKKARKGEFLAKKFGKVVNDKDGDKLKHVKGRPNDELGDDFSEEIEQPPPPKKKKTDSVTRIRRKQLLQANKDEEKNIKSLAKKLKLNKRKNKKLPKSFDEDGLGYILEVVDHPESEDPVGFNLHSDDFDISDDLSKVLGKGNTKEKEDSNSDQSDQDFSDVDQSFDEESDPEMNDNVSDEEDENTHDDSENSDADDFFLTESEMAKREEIDRNKDTKMTNKPTTKPLNEKEPSKIAKKNVTWSDLENKVPLPTVNVTKKKKKTSKKKKISIEFEYEADELEEDTEDQTEDVDNVESSEKEEYWEDIYGRKRDKQGNIVAERPEETNTANKYVPPAKRAQMSEVNSKKKAELSLLKKQLKGLFNRLSESNMKFMADQIEDMYMKNSRNDMNQTIVTVTLEAVVSPAVTPERLVMEHALLIALLHANVGTEVGAHVLQSLAINLDERVKRGGNYGDGKEVDNLMLLICHLYTFKITHNSLIHDVINFLANTFTEKDVELILLILRSIGFGLRKDNPLALKEMIISLQNKAATATALLDQSRVRFMIEALMAIKSNNMHKLPNYDPTLSEHLRKLLRGLLRRGSYVQELHISFADLLKANEQGRWWIVGSAWQGLKENESQADKSTTKSLDLSVTAGFSDKILELARKQRMNTETRKNIFCIIMSAEDFMDAFEKLLHLGLKNQQEREIIHIILDCVMKEKIFNPYYAFLTEKFCQFDRRFQMTLQFALWDKFKELRNLDTHQVSNLAQFLVPLFSKGALPISVLKVIQLSEMEKTLVKFLRQIMLALLLHETEEVCVNVFRRIGGAPKLHMLREGLRLFMHHFLLRNVEKMDSDVAEKLKSRVDIVETVLIEKRK